MFSYLLCWILILFTGITTIIGAIEPKYPVGFLNSLFGSASLALAIHILLKPDRRTKFNRIKNKADNKV